MNWSINGKRIKSLYRNSKEIILIRRTSDNKIIYQKEEEEHSILRFKIYGSEISIPGQDYDHRYVDYTYTWIFTFKENNTEGYINWGDGTGKKYVYGPEPIYESIQHEYVDTRYYNIEIYDVVEIGTGMFYRNEELIEVDMPSTITDVGRFCFYGCPNLEKVSLSENMNTIEESLFEGCNNLKYIIIPSSITDIGYNAFSDCGNVYFYLFWTGNDILSFNNNWRMTQGDYSYIYIPYGEESNYIAKGYPSERLIETDNIPSM